MKYWVYFYSFTWILFLWVVWKRKTEKLRIYIVLLATIGELSVIAQTRTLPGISERLLIIPAPLLKGLKLASALFGGVLLVECTRIIFSRRTSSWSLRKHFSLVFAMGLILMVARIIFHFPTDSISYYKYGRWSVNNGDYKGAIGYLDIAIGFNHKNAKAYLERGYVNLMQGNYMMAVDDYSKAIQIDPQNSKSYGERGRAYLYLENYTTALVDLNKSIRMGNSKVYPGRGYVYNRLGNYSSALIDFNKAVQTNSQDAYSLEGRGWAYFYMGNYDYAVLDWKQAIAIEPGRGKDLNRWIKIALKLMKSRT